MIGQFTFGKALTGRNLEYQILTYGNDISAAGAKNVAASIDALILSENKIFDTKLSFIARLQDGRFIFVKYYNGFGDTKGSRPINPFHCIVFDEEALASLNYEPWNLRKYFFESITGVGINGEAWQSNLTFPVQRDINFETGMPQSERQAYMRTDKSDQAWYIRSQGQDILDTLAPAIRYSLIYEGIAFDYTTDFKIIKGVKLVFTTAALDNSFLIVDPSRLLELKSLGSVIPPRPDPEPSDLNEKVIRLEKQIRDQQAEIDNLKKNHAPDAAILALRQENQKLETTIKEQQLQLDKVEGRVQDGHDSGVKEGLVKAKGSIRTWRIASIVLILLCIGIVVIGGLLNHPDSLDKFKQQISDLKVQVANKDTLLAQKQRQIAICCKGDAVQKLLADNDKLYNEKQALIADIKEQKAESTSDITKAKKEAEARGMRQGIAQGIQDEKQNSLQAANAAKEQGRIEGKAEGKIEGKAAALAECGKNKEVKPDTGQSSSGSNATNKAVITSATTDLDNLMSFISGTMLLPEKKTTCQTKIEAIKDELKKVK